MLAGCLYTLGQDVLSALMLATARVKRLIAVLQRYSANKPLN
jgi:hypothetical protein